MLHLHRLVIRTGTLGKCLFLVLYPCFFSSVWFFESDSSSLIIVNGSNLLTYLNPNL